MLSVFEGRRRGYTTHRRYKGEMLNVKFALLALTIYRSILPTIATHKLKAPAGRGGREHSTSTLRGNAGTDRPPPKQQRQPLRSTDAEAVRTIALAMVALQVPEDAALGVLGARGHGSGHIELLRREP